MCRRGTPDGAIRAGRGYLQVQAIHRPRSIGPVACYRTGLARPGELHIPRNRTAHCKLPLPKLVRAVRSVERGPLRFIVERASPALQVQGYNSLAVFTIHLGLKEFILLE